MDLPVIVAYLDGKRLSVRAIHNDIVATLGPDIGGTAESCATFRRRRFLCSTEEPSDADDRKPIGDADEGFVFALNKSPFASVRQLLRLTHFPLTTVSRCLTQSLGFVECHLGRAPRALSEGQKAQRVTLSRQLLEILEIQQG
jgi:hypothetical protein